MTTRVGAAAARLLPAQAALRAPDTVMRLARMGAFYPTRLSFSRALLRDLAEEQVRVERPVFDIDANGFGRAVYTLELFGHRYSLVAFSMPLDDSQRTDRVIAEAWDTAYVLYDGEPAVSELDRLEAQVPGQETGRYCERDLVLSRANRSVRFFEHVVDALSRGEQPEASAVAAVGYLLRTTAVYGNGKFGIADRARIANRPGLDGAFRVEMLCVWLIRAFSVDLVEHMAAQRAPDTAVRLTDETARWLGVGNATGLGMAPFLANHPLLLNNWMLARETALARVRAVEACDAQTRERAIHLLAVARAHVESWRVDDERQARRLDGLRDELDIIEAALRAALEGARPWDALYVASQAWSAEAGELVVALLVEIFPELVDGLAHCMTSSAVPTLDAGMSVGRLRSLLESHYGFALGRDYALRHESQRFWYVSEEKLEPRLGERYEEPGSERELPLDVARQVAALHASLVAETDEDVSVAELLLREPRHRHVARRVQAAPAHPYAEVRDNLIGGECLPVDLLRCKLSFFGASRFDPKSDRWTRITLFAGMPRPQDVARGMAEFEWLPSPPA